MVLEVIIIKKLEVVVGETKETFTGESLTVSTSSNANQPVALIIRDGELKIGEFASWTYWHKLE